MLTYKKLSKKPKFFFSITGITVSQFDVILRDVRKQYLRTEKIILSKRKRVRNIGTGRPFDLNMQDKLVMLFVYYRRYLTCELTGHLFVLDQGNISRNIKYLEAAVRKSVPIPTKLYADSKKICDKHQLGEFFPHLIVMTMEQSSQSQDPKQTQKKDTSFWQKENAYGKKPNHSQPKR